MVTVWDLSELLRPTPADEPGRFTFEVPEGLQQGRGAWGGIPTGAMVSAVEQTELRPGLVVRTVSAQLIAPLPPGPARIDVEVLRQGVGTTTAAVRLRDAAENTVAHGVVVLGTARPGDDLPDGLAWQSQPVPVELAAGPDPVPVIPLGPPVAPHFLRQLEVRPLTGLPFEGADDQQSIGWVRPVRASRVEAPVLVALADAWWVAVITKLRQARPVGTLAFAVDLLVDPATLPLDDDGQMLPLLHRGRTVAAREGYTVECRELWTVDGRLATWNTQTVAVIK